MMAMDELSKLADDMAEALEVFAAQADGRRSSDLFKGGVCFSQAKLLSARSALRAYRARSLSTNPSDGEPS